MTTIFSQVPAFKESRLRSLYSDFSHLKELNPEGFEANIAAWYDLLNQCLIQHSFNSSITLPGTELSTKLANATYGQPKGLVTVLDAQVKNGKYVPWSIYKFSSPEPQWSLKDYLSPMKWVERKLISLRIESFSLLDGKGGVCADYFINWDRLALLGDKLGERITASVQSEGTYSAKLLDSDLFVDLVRSLDEKLSDLDIQVLLIYLSRDTGKLKVLSDHENAHRSFVKVDTAAITNEDIGIIKVKANIRSIQSRTGILAQRLDKEIPKKIQELLKKGKQDDRLKRVLVQKSYITKSLNKSLSVLSQLNMILDKINDAQSNVSVYDTLTTAKDVLASFNNKISFEDLEKVQQELDEEIVTSNEITDAMVISPDLDEREIDDELEELEREYGLEKDTSSTKTETHKEEIKEEEVGNEVLIHKLLALSLSGNETDGIQNDTTNTPTNQEKRKSVDKREDCSRVHAELEDMEELKVKQELAQLAQ